MSRRIAPQLSFGRKAVWVVAGVSLAVPLAVGVLNVPILKAQSQPSAQPQTQLPFPPASQPKLPEAPQLITQQATLVNPSVLQQPPAEKKAGFEVATIKLATPDAAPKNQMLRPSPDRVSIPSMTLSWLIYTAYGEGMNTLVGLKGGPEWRNQTAYAIEAKAQPSTLRQLQAMLRTLLEDRFGLKVHINTETGNFYALVLDRSDSKLGPNVHPWDGTCLNGQAPTEDDDPVYSRCFSNYRLSGLFVDGATMFNAAEMLSLPASRTLLGRVVQDRTGLTGRYRMELEYPFNPARPADPAAPDSRPSLFTVIREQWGMKLEPAQGPYKVIVVDSAQRPTEN